MHSKQIILGIESSCDETAAAVIVNGELKSNVIAGQDVHSQWGGVVPELASRAHQENIVPVVWKALREADVQREELSAVAYTNGPGLIGALLVGSCFARSIAQGLNIPSIAIDHMQAHIMAHFITDGSDRKKPPFPFLNLTVSGGHTLIIQVNSPSDMLVLGATMDDAAGEAFDKAAKILGLPYPGGPQVSKWAKSGNPEFLELPFPAVSGLNMSFSGLKTAFQEKVRYHYKDPLELQAAMPDLCASVENAIVKILISKLRKAIRQTGINQLGLAGGVSANPLLRARVTELAKEFGGTAFIPPPVYCTDNAAMIAQAGVFMHQAGITSPLNTVPYTRMV
jgi:N6-L-threonylcarbamoyladenine synthase